MPIYAVASTWDDCIFTKIYHKNRPNVGKHAIHGWYGHVYKIDLGGVSFGRECPSLGNISHMTPNQTKLVVEDGTDMFKGM